MANWFEGGRRITQLIQGLVVLGGAVYLVTGGNGNAVVFETTYPDQNFRPTHSPCNYPDVIRRLPASIDFNRGDPREVQLCFRQWRNGIAYRIATADEGPVIIRVPTTQTIQGRAAPPPVIRAPPRSYWVAGKDNPFVQSYMARRVRVFMDANTWQAIGRQSLFEGKVRRFWNRTVEAFPWVFGICVFLTIFSATLGWIVRGFAGVPSGKDFRNAP